jgi:serine/threonine protein kinase
MARAEREARNAARLRGVPNIVAIYDVVLDGAPWIVMQLVVGQSLHERIEAEGRLSTDEVARIGSGILRAGRARRGDRSPGHQAGQHPADR